MLFKSLQFSSSCEYSACFDAHLIAQALLVFVMRIKNWFDFEREVILCNFAARKVAQDHFPFYHTVYCDIIQPRLRSDVDRGEHSVTLNDYGPCHMKVASYALCWVSP